MCHGVVVTDRTIVYGSFSGYRNTLSKSLFSVIKAVNSTPAIHVVRLFGYRNIGLRCCDSFIFWINVAINFIICSGFRVVLN